MSPRKLSDSDREKILNLYRTSEETTSTLATRYSVSSSTISRFLKSNLSESEYEDLIQQKRLARSAMAQAEAKSKDISGNNQVHKDSLETRKNGEDKNLVTPKPAREKPKSPSIIKTKSTKELETETKTEISPETPNQETQIASGEKVAQKTTLEVKAENKVKFEEPHKPIIFLDQEKDLESINILEAMFGEDIEDEDDLDEDDEDEDWDDEVITPKEIPSRDRIKVLPLSEASFPHTCYLVIDRSAELITRPLKDFADLGTIPTEEVQQKTLPVFDNHRVAKRFSNRRGKVIKVPDARILQKTSPYLEAKGITRLLIDGQIYALS